MTTPDCVSSDDFAVDGDGAVYPRSQGQWRHVATNQAASLQTSYVLNGGSQAADLLQLQVAWTNTDANTMKVYGLLTRGGSIVTTEPRNRLYIETYLGAASGVSPADPTASTLFGRFGQGSDLGTYVDDSTHVHAMNIQTRLPERTVLFGDTVTLTTGQSYKLRVRLRADGAVWEPNTITFLPGTSESELSIVTGATRLDLFAYPVL